MLTEIDGLVVGGGPAGLGAATVCGRAGLRVQVVDEYHRPGGRLLGQLHEEPDSGEWFNGLSAAEQMVHDAESAGVDIACGVQVWGLSQEDGRWRVRLRTASDGVPQTSELLAKHVVLATGAAEKPVPVPGWTLPGVMSVGAAQIMANVHRVRPGQRAIIVGINVLALTIARELQLAGVEVLALVLPPPGACSGEAASPRAVLTELAGLSHLAPSALLRTAGKFGKSRLGSALGQRFYPKQGMKVWDIPVQARKAAMAIVGEGRVEAVELASLDGGGTPGIRRERVEVDLVCIAGGLYPLAELAAGAGCALRDVAGLGGAVPVHGPHLRTEQSGLYLAGNISGVEGAMVAHARGRLAGTAVAVDAGGIPSTAASERLQAAIEAVEEARNEAPIRFHPELEDGHREMAAIWQERAGS